MSTIQTPPAPPRLTRRAFLGSAGTASAGSVLGLSRGLFPSWMPRLAFRDARRDARGDTLIVISLRGGMDALSVVIPYAEGGLYYDKRPTIGIKAPGKATDSAIDLDGRFGLHPALRPLSGLIQDKQFAAIHAVGSPDGSRSHFQQMEVMERGAADYRVSDAGWINRHLRVTATQNDSPFRAVGLGDMLPTSLTGSIPALALRSIADFHLNGNDDQLGAMKRALESLYTSPAAEARLSRAGQTVFSTMDTLSRFSPDNYTPSNGAKYPETDFGMGLSQIAQLIKGDVGLEVACIDLGGWDTHENETDQLSAALTELAEGVAAFTLDVRDRMNQITLVTLSEFGRRLEENASRGTDHGHGGCMFVVGGGVNGGVYTQWPGLGEDKLDDGDLAITTDFRDVLSEIVALRLNNPAVAEVFPGYTPRRLGLVRPTAT